MGFLREQYHCVLKHRGYYRQETFHAIPAYQKSHMRARKALVSLAASTVQRYVTFLIWLAKGVLFKLAHSYTTIL